jgi:hypothetical protein
MLGVAHSSTGYRCRLLATFSLFATFVVVCNLCCCLQPLSLFATFVVAAAYNLAAACNVVVVCNIL